MPGYHLAQLNIARTIAPLDDPRLADFVALLDSVNAVADRSPGFVWRLKTDAGNATDIQAYDDALILINMSVWESPEHLKQFVYAGSHLGVMRQRAQWFDRQLEAYYVLWWVPAGHIPTIDEAKARLEHLRQHGETPHAFSFARLYPTPDAGATTAAPSGELESPA